eukprot:gnl/Dysnectes_brevis/420_a463_2027.p1 GENE.gnl/Dysnectes_brevis/420_a463_2027~~gnl/Dysnectes_brevis/420_a463_2027.p1  ORF type:complete len:1457 (-),score=699.61 gnl/Dysnectes_brevis/420_a463_2027:62-4432(-)
MTSQDLVDEYSRLVRLMHSKIVEEVEVKDEDGDTHLSEPSDSLEESSRSQEDITEETPLVSRSEYSSSKGKKTKDRKDHLSVIQLPSESKDDDEGEVQSRGCFNRGPLLSKRTIFLNSHTIPAQKDYPLNVIKNTKYTWWSFIPIVLFEQFKFFFNLYYLLIVITQFFPPLKVGFLFTYVAPLAFVLSITIVKEGYDDMKRKKRDDAANSEPFLRLRRDGGKAVVETVPASDIGVGQLLVIEANQRLPADCLLLKTSERSGACFIRTDQLDGETDWKLRRAVHSTQSMSDAELLRARAVVQAARPIKEIYKFVGALTSFDPRALSPVDPSPPIRDALTLENTMWANTVLANGRAVALVLYTGTETRSVLNANRPRQKVGVLDMEINKLTKVLCLMLVLLSLAMVSLSSQPFGAGWWLQFFRFILLFSAIIPISMRVNLDLAKAAFSWMIQADKDMVEPIVRSSTIPEQLGRISYVLSDKCLGRDTPVLMANGEYKMVQDIGVGEHLMGDDNTVRTVHTLATGTQGMARVTLARGSSFVCNMSHILTLFHTGTNQTIDIAVTDFLALPKDEQLLHRALTVSAPLTFHGAPPQRPFAPDQPRIHAAYGSVDQRRYAMAGMVDRAGTYVNDSFHFEGIPEPLLQDIAFVARSLGLYAEADATHCTVTGPLHIIPTRVPGKQVPEREGLTAHQQSFTVTPLPEDTYYGFTLDGNGRFVINHEMIITHNTGTLTQNEMVFQQFHNGFDLYSVKSMSLVASELKGAYESIRGEDQEESSDVAVEEEDLHGRVVDAGPVTRSHRGFGAFGVGDEETGGTGRARKLYRTVRSIAQCHNVTPVTEEEEDGTLRVVDFQASSPDEVALVRFALDCGLHLVRRELKFLELVGPDGELERLSILEVFPFSSATKRMAIITRSQDSGDIALHVKGADNVIISMAAPGSNLGWVREQVQSMAMKGLRTLVFGSREIDEAEWERFQARLTAAKSSMVDRERLVLEAESSLLHSLEILCVTGVEDKLQPKVRLSLQQFRNAGIRTWMLTGDKVETAKCIARSTNLVSPQQSFFQIRAEKPEEARRQIRQLQRRDCSDALVIDGSSLAVVIGQGPITKNEEDESNGWVQSLFGGNPHGPGSLGGGLREEFVQVATRCSAVVCCRCSPEQKALVVELVKTYTGLQVAGIGDGGNDVSMIQAADVGIGLVGKEGKQASLASDFSITRFSDLRQLLFWHGRNSYIRSANMAQFVMQRGITVSVMQAVFSAAFFFSSIPLFTGWLSIGYSTFYTALPVLAIILDQDVTKKQTFTYPELYRELVKGRTLSMKTFLLWLAIAVWEGGIIMVLSILTLNDNMFNIVGVSFSTLIVVELLTLGFGIHRWDRWMISSEVVSMLFYVFSLLFMDDYFSLSFIFSVGFWVRVTMVSIVAVLPPFVVKWVAHCISPPTQVKLVAESKSAAVDSQVNPVNVHLFSE